MFTQKAKEVIMKAWHTEYVCVIKLSFDINNAGLCNHKVTALVGQPFREFQFTMDWDDRQKEFTNVNPKPEIEL